MPAPHRYWRASGLESYSAGAIEMSCFHLLGSDGARLDAPATLTASTVPSVGSTGAIKDDDLSTSATWPAAAAATLVLMWDFGVSQAVDVQDIRLAGDSAARFLLIVRLAWSDDNLVWQDVVTPGRTPVFAGIVWPGARTKTLSDTRQSVQNTFNPSDKNTSITLSNSNLTAQRAVVNAAAAVRAVYAVNGKIYWEIKLTASPTAAVQAHVGVMGMYDSLDDYVGSGAGWGYSLSSGAVINNGVAVRPAGTLPVPVINDVIGFALDTDSGKLWIARNGVWLLSGDPATGVNPVVTTSGVLLAGVSFSQTAAGTTGVSATFNGGAYALPTGFTSAMSGWGVRLLKVLTRSTTVDAQVIYSLPAVSYAAYAVVQPNDLQVLSIELGAVKDILSGVFGSGIGRIAGTVKDTTGTPGRRRVRLMRDADGLLMREVWSNAATGAYSFDYIDELQKFTVLSYDHTGSFRAVVADGQIPELIT